MLAIVTCHRIFCLLADSRNLNHTTLLCCAVPQNTSLKEITNTINVTGVTRVKLSEDDIRKVINTLIADCRCGTCTDLVQHMYTPGGKQCTEGLLAVSG
jgi:hypothetical protein